jgi:glycyl-tRNA synthetase beta chain
MSELLIELFSEEMPPNLQINARNQFKKIFGEALLSLNLKYKSFEVYSTPTRLTATVSGLPNRVKVLPTEIKGPKLGVPQNVVESFAKSKNIKLSDLYKKKLEKGVFYFAKTKGKEIIIEEELIKNIPKSLGQISWKKSMKWSSHNLGWGRPLRSILSIFNKKYLKFNYGHIETANFTLIEDGLEIKQKRIKDFKDYEKFLKKNEIILDHSKRERFISDRIKSICRTKSFEEKIDQNLLLEVSNLVDKPRIIVAKFDKNYLKLPKEVIKSALQFHQKYFTLIDHKGRINNEFIIVINKKDAKKLIKIGNERVVEARLSDASFFWERDKSLNLIKQINKLKKIIFYENLGTIYDKTQRLRQMAYFISDQLNLNKEKIEIAASISKSDLVSDLVGEFPELQGVMGKYFASNQGFGDDISLAISEHYLPISISSFVAKKPISYALSILDKLDTLVGFYLINEKPTSSKDPFALRRAAIGLLRTIIENNLTVKIRDLIDYFIKIYLKQGVTQSNNEVDKELITFFRERMKNILKEKKIRTDIIEASISSHLSDDFLELYKKTLIMNKFISKDLGKNAVSTYKRASNILDQETLDSKNGPDAVLFKQDEEKELFERINNIRKVLTLKEERKDYEKHLRLLSETKSSTDKFFDKVKVNDENQDLKNNRLELLQILCSTFNSFIDFSKLEGT